MSLFFMGYVVGIWEIMKKNSVLYIILLKFTIKTSSKISFEVSVHLPFLYYYKIN